MRDHRSDRPFTAPRYPRTFAAKGDAPLDVTRLLAVGTYREELTMDYDYATLFCLARAKLIRFKCCD